MQHDAAGQSKSELIVQLLKLEKTQGLTPEFVVQHAKSQKLKIPLENTLVETLEHCPPKLLRELTVVFSKGKTGKVLSVNAEKATVTVEHANIIKKHTRPNPQKNVRGGIVDKEGPIHVSNVMLVCPSCGKHTRAGHTTLPDGTKTRTCRRCNATFEN